MVEGSIVIPVLHKPGYQNETKRLQIVDLRAFLFSDYANLVIYSLSVGE